MKRNCGAMLAFVVGVIMLMFAVLPAVGQWERVAGGPPQNKTAQLANTPPRPLAYFLAFSPERYTDNSLCLGCKTSDGQKVSIADYVVKPSERYIGESFGRKIVEIVLTFDVKPGSAMWRLRREWEAQYRAEVRKGSLEELPPVEWKSVVMESASERYRELYFIIDEPGIYDRPMEHPRIVDTGGVPVLAVADRFSGNGGMCTEGYWVLRRDGPWLLDFSPVRKTIASISPPNATAPQIGCWALSIEKLEVNAPVQKNDAKCHACEWLGTAIVDFRIETNRAVPVSSRFKAESAE